MKNDALSLWQENLAGTPDGELLKNMTESEIFDAFSSEIAFGTGGLRAVMGIGPNRLNRYTVKRVTQGLAKTILEGSYPKSVCVAYDTRHNSEMFADVVCKTLSEYGICVYRFDKPVPTPALSFAIRKSGFGWGVVLTASHNPQEYNGYKVYDCRGVQVTDSLANKITANIESFDYFSSSGNHVNGSISYIETSCLVTYYNEIVKFTERSGESSCPQSTFSDYPIVYSALYGAGANAVPNVLSQLGFSVKYIQQEPDGSFGGLKTPNPEEPIVYESAISVAKEHDCRLILATDPDCDRVGVLEKHDNDYKLLSGNQIGALLIDYLAKINGVSSGDTVITTIVSGKLGELISRSFDLKFVRLLTGFKYIGDYAESLGLNQKFFFGYEESFGFLVGDGARDKDAVLACALIAQMALYYHNQGLTLFNRWLELSDMHGYCLESLHSAHLPIDEQKKVMNSLRTNIKIAGVTKAEDYLDSLYGLPKSNVVKLYFDDGSWAAFRPSGTEPKIKLYTGVCCDSYDEAVESLNKVNNVLLPLISSSHSPKSE